jgi:hypothetical protein
MLIGNLPIAGNAPIAAHNENRQRVSQFRSLENALLDGDMAGAKESTELLQRNAPNAALSAQLLRQFGHDNQADQQFEVLENAANGNLLGSQAVSAVVQRDAQQDRRHDFSDPDNPADEPNPSTTNPASVVKNVGVSLDTLA